MFKTRTKPRRIAREADKEDPEDAEGEYILYTGSVVKRPGLSSNAKKPSKLRLSFGPSEGPEDDSEDVKGAGAKAGNGLLKSATERSTLKRSLNPPVGLGGLPLRAGGSEDRPTYSKDYLSELRNSTPSTPATVSAETSDNEGSSAELVPQLGSSQQVGQLVDNERALHIPTDAEIREKKERRARLAKEQDFISPDDAEDENEISLLPRKAKPESRLTRDDEDFAEGFDDFVEDGGIALGRKAQAEQRLKTRAEINEMIQNAEESSDDDDSEAERNRAYDAAQTRAGMDGLARHQEDGRSRVPTIITPIPRLPTVIEKFRGLLREKEAKKALLVRQMEALQREKAEIGVREVEIQNLITETGNKYEQLRLEAGLEKDTQITNAEPQMGRGLEDIGT
ncbi:hypothetical protein UCRPC4_g00698 [Phaeomoniella chlamydospora]|uniref:Nineteen complex-related protein 2 domain-containing protein n=1 Tax=Phaeomoniella chlamydospora TaxID=158046 RepID=A0A0G2HI52_PHACM|nr:hypothetical protein UCRPC4_g00698 [Phaeomoniella chlamydospora]